MALKKTFEQYLKIKAVNWSTLKEMNRSPLHYKYRLEHPREDSAGLARGRAIHTAVFEPEKFMQEYVIFEGKTRRGKEWDEFAALHDDKTILKQDEYDKAWQAAAAVRKHPDVAAFMCNGVPERAYTWTHKDTFLKCKCRVDWVGEVLFDLKSTGDVDARKFGNLAARMLYHGQCASYAEGSKHVGPVYMVAVEAEPPFDVAVFKLGEDELLIGRELYEGLLARVAECRKTDLWPGKHPEVQPLSLPRYVYGSEDEEGGSFEVVSEM